MQWNRFGSALSRGNMLPVVHNTVQAPSKALAALDPIRLQHVGGTTDRSLARRWTCFQCLQSKPDRACHKLRSGLPCRDLGAAQQRYCSYFERALYALPPRALRLVLRHVLFGSLEAVVAKGGSKYGPLLHQSRSSQHSVRHLLAKSAFMLQHSNVCSKLYRYCSHHLETANTAGPRWRRRS